MQSSSSRPPATSPPHPPFAPPAKFLLSAIVDSSDDAIVSKSLDGIITSWNKSAELIFGYTAAEIVGQSVLRLIPPALHGDEAALLERVRRGERIEHYTSERVRKDGSLVPVSLTISPIRNDEGAIIGASNVCRDMTAQQEAARASALLAAIVESSEDAIISKDLDGIITSWNKSAERIFGYAPAEIIGRSVLTLIPPEMRHEEPGILARVRTGERIEHHETLRMRKDGTRIDVALTISPIKDHTGRIIGVSKVARDITEHRRGDRATRLLAAIVDSSDDAIVSKNLNGIITSWNAGATRIFGYTADETIGRPVSMLFPPDRMDEEPKILERLKRGERVDHYQTVRVRKDGRHLHVSLTISPIKDPSGKVVGASKVARDVTPEKHWIAQLEAANEELKKADRMKSEFLAIMSHELRTPLNSIIGFASVLRQGRSGPVTDEQFKQLSLIHTSGKHLLHLINDLLDLSRIEAGRVDLDCEEFKPAEVVDEAVRTLELQSSQKKLAIHAKVDFGDTIYSDRKRFFQVVLNLLNNAVKFTPRGKVDIRVHAEGGNLILSVADTGIGVPREKQRELFQAFSQLEGSSRRRYEGTGLGLYLCKKIVTMLNGHIKVDSDGQHGSVFTVTLPLRHVDCADGKPLSEPAHA